MIFSSIPNRHLSRSGSVFFSMLSFSVNSISSRAARPMLTAVGRADVRWHSESLMKDTRSSPPAPARSSTARLRQPTMAMAGAPRTCRVKGHRVTGPPALLSQSQHFQSALTSAHWNEKGDFWRGDEKPINAFILIGNTILS